MDSDNSSCFYTNEILFTGSPAVFFYCMDGYNVVQEPVSSFETLADRLAVIKEQARQRIPIPFSVDIALQGKGYISVGLGSDESIIIWYNAPRDIYLTSLGDETAKGTKLYYFGDWTRLAAKHTISWQTALGVIKAWIECGEIQDCIAWTPLQNSGTGSSGL